MSLSDFLGGNASGSCMIVLPHTWSVRYQYSRVPAIGIKLVYCQSKMLFLSHFPFSGLAWRYGSALKHVDALDTARV